ncbi:MAG: TetR/AcrR family transcriptional regulator [Ruminococcus sp.]|nr:TetR/AcrR family transcriptional regulator [Ruminococcus sp.]
MSNPDKNIDPRLLASAKAEFLEKGYLKAELKTICGNANITTGALYKRYKGKEDLFCAVVKDIADQLTDFMKQRRAVDLSAFTDEQICSLWTMTYDSMLTLFKMLYDSRDSFALLIGKAAGTRYEDFSHGYVTEMSYAYVQYYSEAKRRGLAEAKVTREEFHVLLSSFWTCICEPFIHGMSWTKIKAHCHTVCRFFNWKDVIMLKEGTENV